VNNLATLLEIKARLILQPADTADDAILQNALNAISGRFYNDCNRQFDYLTSWQFEFPADLLNIVPDRSPIDRTQPVTWEVKDSEALGFVVQNTPVPDFIFGRNNNVFILQAPLGTNLQMARVTYGGGFVLPGNQVGSSQIALPSDIEQACVEQVAYWYQRRNQLGLVSVGGEGGTISQYRTLDLLPSVVAVLKKYERFVL
jgi:hypothetical protein